MNLPYCIPLEVIKLLFEKSITNNFKDTRKLYVVQFETHIQYIIPLKYPQSSLSHPIHDNTYQNFKNYFSHLYEISFLHFTTCTYDHREYFACTRKSSSNYIFFLQYRLCC